MGRNSWRALLAGVSCALIAAVAWSVPPDYDERPRELKTPTAHWDYEYRSAKIPMRDGVKLHTVILVPKGAKNAPILLTRTPYDAEGMTSLHPRSRLAAALAVATSGEVRWRVASQRHWLRWPWAATLLTAGLFLDGALIPALPATAVGLLATTILLVGLHRLRRRERRCQEEEELALGV